MRPLRPTQLVSKTTTATVSVGPEVAASQKWQASFLVFLLACQDWRESGNQASLFWTPLTVREGCNFSQREGLTVAITQVFPGRGGDGHAGGNSPIGLIVVILWLLTCIL